MSAGVNGEPWGRGQVGMLLKSHRLIQMILYTIKIAQKKFFFTFLHPPTDLADILVHLVLSEWALVFVVAEQPEARGAVKVVIGDVEVIGTSSEDSNLILCSSGRLHRDRLLQRGLRERDELILGLH